MKKISILLLTIMIFFSCGKISGETTVNNNSLRYRDGLVKYSEKNFTGTSVVVSVKGMVSQLRHYKDGKITSLETYSKIIMDESNYNIMKLDGKKIPINKLKRTEVKDGFATIYFPESTKVFEKFEIKFEPSEFNPAEYVKHGVYQKFDEKGTIIEENKFKDGKLIQ